MKGYWESACGTYTYMRGNLWRSVNNQGKPELIKISTSPNWIESKLLEIIEELLNGRKTGQ